MGPGLQPPPHNGRLSLTLPQDRSIAASKSTSNSPFGKTGTTHRGLGINKIKRLNGYALNKRGTIVSY